MRFTNVIQGLLFDVVYQLLIRWRPGTTQGEGNRSEAQFKQAVATLGLVIIIAFGNGPRDQFDLPIIQPETFISDPGLWLYSAVIGQKYPTGTTFNKSGRNRRTFNIGQRLRGKNDTDILLSKCFSHSRIRAENSGSSKNTHASSRISKVGDPLNRASNL